MGLVQDSESDTEMEDGQAPGARASGHDSAAQEAKPRHQPSRNVAELWSPDVYRKFTEWVANHRLKQLYPDSRRCKRLPEIVKTATSESFRAHPAALLGKFIARYPPSPPSVDSLDDDSSFSRVASRSSPPAVLYHQVCGEAG